MSIVAVRDGIIAADTGCTGGGIKFPMRKLLRRDDVAVGWAGHWADGRIFAEWFFGGANMEALPIFHHRNDSSPQIDFAAIVLRPDGWSYWNEWFVPETSEDVYMEFFAIGSGAAAALAAMHMGAGAVEAAHIACRVAEGCAEPVMMHAIKPAQ